MFNTLDIQHKSASTSTEDRLLVIDTTWLETKDLIVGIAEVVAQLAIGRSSESHRYLSKILIEQFNPT